MVLVNTEDYKHRNPFRSTGPQRLDNSTQDLLVPAAGAAVPRREERWEITVMHSVTWDTDGLFSPRTFAIVLGLRGGKGDCAPRLESLQF